ncbi:MAG: anti-sigma factor [Rhodococcus sp.]|nr:anti-sigma factor [Rhodococcus sp. (in: high G+C Gram-positive bacteria)]
MNEHSSELLDLAPAYALDAVDDADRREIDNAVETAHPEIRADFSSAVREAQETMAAYSATTATRPPARLLDRILKSISETDATPTPRLESLETSEPTDLDRARARRNRILVAVGAAAAVVVIAVGGTAITQQFQSTPSEPMTAQIMAADDVRTTTAEIGTGGSATFVYSQEMNAGMLVMNDVAPPESDSVYQMWLLGAGDPESVGIMGQDDVGPSTTAVIENLDQATTLGFTLEPAGGSPQPTSDPFAAISFT